MRDDPVFKLYRAVGALIVTALMVVLVAKLPVNQARLGDFEASRLHQGLNDAVAYRGLAGSLNCPLMIHGDDLTDLATQFEERGAIGSGEPVVTSCSIDIHKRGSHVEATLEAPDGMVVSVSRPRILWTAILPAMLALMLAVITRRLIISLFLGVALGGLLGGLNGSHYGWLNGASMGTLSVFHHVLTDDFHLWIFVFTFSLIGLVNVTTASGGMGGVARLLGKLAHNARSAQLATAMVGLAIFFDDYSNTVVVGGSMRSLSDSMRVSREKLAYIVDSTAAPLAGLALISTWIGYEVSLIGNAMNEIGLEGSPYAMFLSTLPFRFYCILTIVFLLINISMKREYGPMLDAQRRAMDTGEVMRPGSMPLSGGKSVTEYGIPKARNALAPVLLVVFATLGGMALNGAGVVAPWRVDFAALMAFEPARLVSLADNYIILCEDGAWVLAMASIMGSLLAFLQGRYSAKVPWKPLLGSWFAAGRMLMLAFSILILAWAIGRVNTELGTGAFLVSTLADSIAPWLLPIIIFLLAAFISFATGSSWSTMAILLPAAVPLAYHVGGLPFMIISVGAVLDGSIFGDHCSPLSDTTIMSSISAGCDHLDHVRTQLPYAVTVSLAAVGIGYALATVWHPLVAYVVSGLLFALLFKLIGGKVEEKV
jgi:Na+/H+ antiporter NhaC